jgi:hypothetical protein
VRWSRDTCRSLSGGFKLTANSEVGRMNRTLRKEEERTLNNRIKEGFELVEGATVAKNLIA